jgi:hypothetical protein
MNSLVFLINVKRNKGGQEGKIQKSAEKQPLSG